MSEAGFSFETATSRTGPLDAVVVVVMVVRGIALLALAAAIRDDTLERFEVSVVRRDGGTAILSSAAAALAAAAGAFPEGVGGVDDADDKFIKLIAVGIK
jgi:hypothetical protein